MSYNHSIAIKSNSFNAVRYWYGIYYHNFRNIAWLYSMDNVNLAGKLYLVMVQMTTETSSVRTIAYRSAYETYRTNYPKTVEILGL